MEEIRAAGPRPQSADQPSMWRGRKPKHETPRPVLKLTNKTNSHGPHPFQNSSSVSHPGKLERNGVTEKIPEALKNSVLSGWQQFWARNAVKVSAAKYVGIFVIKLCTIYRVSQEERNKLRESVTYVKLYRYNPKHLYPKLNGYGCNGQRKVWTSCISA